MHLLMIYTSNDDDIKISLLSDQDGRHRADGTRLLIATQTDGHKLQSQSSSVSWTTIIIGHI